MQFIKENEGTKKHEIKKKTMRTTSKQKFDEIKGTKA